MSYREDYDEAGFRMLELPVELWQDVPLDVQTAYSEYDRQLRVVIHPVTKKWLVLHKAPDDTEARPSNETLDLGPVTLPSWWGVAFIHDHEQQCRNAVRNLRFSDRWAMHGRDRTRQKWAHEAERDNAIEAQRERRRQRFRESSREDIRQLHGQLVGRVSAPGQNFVKRDSGLVVPR